MQQTTVFAAHNEWLVNWYTDYANNGGCDFPVITMEEIYPVEDGIALPDASDTIDSDTYDKILKAVYKAAGEQE